MCIVRGGWDGHAPSAADVGVTQLIGQGLKFIGIEPVIIPQDVVVRGTTGAL